MYIKKLESSSGISDVQEIDNDFFLHPDIQVDGRLYLANIHGKQTIIQVKERHMDNSDGSEWSYYGQKKTIVLYLAYNDEDDGKRTFEWYYHCDIED